MGKGGYLTTATAVVDISVEVYLTAIGGVHVTIGKAAVRKAANRRWPHGLDVTEG
jgi:hypothetical protein